MLDSENEETPALHQQPGARPERGLPMASSVHASEDIQPLSKKAVDALEWMARHDITSPTNLSLVHEKRNYVNRISFDASLTELAGYGYVDTNLPVPTAKHCKVIGSRGPGKTSQKVWITPRGRARATRSMSSRSAWIYRMHSADGELLYIGKTEQDDLLRRFRGHEESKDWFDDVETVTFARSTPFNVMAEEVEAIRTEHPLHNIQHNQ